MIIKEIERKFLVIGDYKADAAGKERIVQGYLSSNPNRSVRIRICGGRGYITVKSGSDVGGASRMEWETEIDACDADALLSICEPGVIDKFRYYVPVDRHIFEVDEFMGDNEGLVIAEIELGTEDEDFPRPQWLGREVTRDERYYNSMLSRFPFCKWK